MDKEDSEKVGASCQGPKRQKRKCGGSEANFIILPTPWNLILV
jgi:hypothetical protein